MTDSTQVLQRSIFVEVPGGEPYLLVEKGTSYPAIRSFQVTNQTVGQQQVHLHLLMSAPEDASGYRSFQKFVIGPLPRSLRPKQLKILISIKMEAQGWKITAEEKGRLLPVKQQQ